MVKIEQFISAGISYVESKDFEVVEVSSERNLLHEYKSLTFNYGFEFEDRLRNLLLKKFKNPQYKIAVVGDETKNDVKSFIIYLLLESKEMIDFVMDSQTLFQPIEIKVGDNVISKIPVVCPDVLEEKPESTKLTKFEQACRFWGQEIQRYLSSVFDFDGVTKIKALGCKSVLKKFDITVSGKGVDDDIVRVMKEISYLITNTEYMLYFNEDEIFSFINAYFKS